MTVPPPEPPVDPFGPADYGPPPGYASPPAYGPPAGYAAPQGIPAYGPPGYGRPEDTTWSVLAHLSVFVLSLIGPLVIYLIYKDTSPFTRHHAAEALNFHLTLLIATLVSFVLIFVVVGIVLLPAVIVTGWVFGVIAAVAAGNRTLYRYPLSIRFVS